MKEVTSAYLDGIKEGRNMYNQHSYLDPAHELESFNILVKSHSGAIKDFYKGQRDFWKNQLKKETTQ